jgi:two-component system cell cycle sensor histidine kinase/response regulator CckA
VKAIVEVVPLNSLISDYLKAPEFEKLRTCHPQVFFRTHLATGLLNIQGSPVHLEKAVMNLVSNAAEAILDGGTVEIRTHNVYLEKPLRGYDAVR